MKEFCPTVGDTVRAAKLTGVILEISDGLALIQTATGSQFCYAYYGLKPVPKEETQPVVEVDPKQLTMFP